MRVVLCDDSGLFRAGLASLLKDLGVDVAAEVDNADRLLGCIATTSPDVAIVDLRLPPSFTDEGLAAALTLRERHPALGVLVLSTYVETTYAMRLLAHDVGGVGYLLKDRVDDGNELLNAIKRLSRGETVVDPMIVSRLLQRSRAESVLDTLTEREAQVLALLAQGRTNAAIAGELFLSPKTVETHVAATFTKLHLPDARDSNRRVLAVLTYLRASSTS